MPDFLLKIAASEPEKFIAEVIRCNGKESTAAVWAAAVVREISYAKKMLKKASK